MSPEALGNNSWLEIQIQKDVGAKAPQAAFALTEDEIWNVETEGDAVANRDFRAPKEGEAFVKLKKKQTTEESDQSMIKKSADIRAVLAGYLDKERKAGGPALVAL